VQLKKVIKKTKTTSIYILLRKKIETTMQKIRIDNNQPMWQVGTCVVLASPKGCFTPQATTFQIVVTIHRGGGDKINNQPGAKVKTRKKATCVCGINICTINIRSSSNYHDTMMNIGCTSYFIAITVLCYYILYYFYQYHDIIIWPMIFYYGSHCDNTFHILIVWFGLI